MIRIKTTLAEVMPNLDIGALITGFTTSAVLGLLGGWNADLSTLLLFMLFDLLLGSGTAILFNTSTKTESGKLSSKEFLKGLFKKGCMLILVMVAHRIDLTFGFNYVKTSICITLIVNETISILETYKTTGMSYPKILDKIIETVQKDKN